jgi:hypothetical protein
MIDQRKFQWGRNRSFDVILQDDDNDGVDDEVDDDDDDYDYNDDDVVCLKPCVVFVILCPESFNGYFLCYTANVKQI